MVEIEEGEFNFLGEIKQKTRQVEGDLVDIAVDLGINRKRVDLAIQRLEGIAHKAARDFARSSGN